MTGPCEIDHTLLRAHTHTLGPLEQWGEGGQVGYGTACFSHQGTHRQGCMKSHNTLMYEYVNYTHTCGNAGDTSHTEDSQTDSPGSTERL